MKSVIAMFSLLILSQFCLGQATFSINEGGSNQSEYFSSIPYENINGKILLNVKIKDKFYRFILDTGAPTSISSKLSDELNPTLITKIRISDANNKTDSLSVVRLNNIAIGDISFTDIPTLVIKNNPIFECFQVDGFIGSNLLRNSIVQVDNTSKNIVITNDEKKLTLNPKHSSDLMLDKQSGPVITIYLKNKKKAKEQLLLDLGMNGFYDLSLNHFHLFSKYEIFKVLANAKGSNSIGLFGIAEDTLQHRILLPQMEINNFKVSNIYTETTINDNSRIGSKILEYGIVTIDYKNKKFYFTPFNKNDIDASERKFPIDFVPRNNQLYVSFVWDKDITDKISKDDQIITIDDISYENVSICDIIIKESIFKDKNSVKLTTRNQKGEKVETVIERK
jgi:predicted aspartyl protease